MNGIKGGVFLQDNVRFHTAFVMQSALQRGGMLPWLARSPDLSPIEHVWGIIGQQFQQHPQPALIVPEWTQEIQESDVRHQYDTLHASMYSKFWWLHRLLV
ncbi:transposable element Tc1 transposase [Trichonephila clavipes]|nr:transposable element Tc1 transposase [Trichonephila clavipes]